MYTLYRSPADHVITILRTTATQKIFLYYSLVDLRLWPSNFHNKGRVSAPGKSGNYLEDQKKSGKFGNFWKKSGKSKKRKFLSMQIFNFEKNPCASRNVCSWTVYDNQLYIWCYYLQLVLRRFNIANPFYFNLSDIFFNLD